MDWQPPDADDGAVQAWFGAHQLRDKGFGPALGPRATAHAAALLAAAGYRTQALASDWLVDAQRSPRDRSLLQTLLDGMATAAAEQAPGAAPTVQAWHARRSAPLARAGALAASRLRLGHMDLLGWPAA